MSWFEPPPTPSPLSPLEELLAVEKAFHIVDEAWGQSLVRRKEPLGMSTSNYLFRIRQHIKERMEPLEKKVFYDKS